ncbi:hypothetical protein SALBM311S_00200 [Streptomyces alboniger]
MDLLERFRMTVGAAALGFARRAADTALARARTRQVGGCLFIDHQLTKASLADMDVQLNAAALLVVRAAWEADRGSPRFARHSGIAKLHATEEAQRIVDTAVQLLGASGRRQGQCHRAPVPADPVSANLRGHLGDHAVDHRGHPRHTSCRPCRPRPVICDL